MSIPATPTTFNLKSENPLPPRIERLLNRFPPSGREKTWFPNGADERSLLLWKYFTSHPDEPLPLRFAHGLGYVMSSIAIAIHPDELIVGEVGLEDVAVTRREMLAQAQAFWQERNDAFTRSFAWHADELHSGQHGLSWKWCNRDGHAIPAFESLLSQGVLGLSQLAVLAAARLVEGEPGAGDSPGVYWQAMRAALQALSAYILRYAALARELSQVEVQPRRRDELNQIAIRCEWLSAHPPRTFLEALQLVWFCHLGIKLDDGGVGHSFGRFDQYLLPFLRADLSAGKLDLSIAAELLALFWIKLNREDDDIAHLSLGGQTSAGEDAVNELSFLCLQVERWVNRKQPNLSTRVHSRTTPAYWRMVAETVRHGAGHPAIFNDEVIVSGLIEYGFPRQVALDYAQVGCVETFLPGLSAPWTDCYLNLAKCLELALNNGKDLLDDAWLGPQTGGPSCLNSFDKLIEAFEAQVEAAMRQMLAAKDEYDQRISQHAPEPLNSVFIHDCLERGLDASGGGARYLLTGVYGVGLGTAVDSLAAIRILVFEQGRISLEMLISALRSNFIGFDRLRQFCLNRAPKYGNDDDRADEIACRLIEGFGRQVRSYSDDAWQALLRRQPGIQRRAYHYAMFGSVLSHTGMGALTAASANGRLARQTLSDGGSPSQGCNRHGATATLCSLAKADYRLAPGGAALNLRLSPGHFLGDEGLDRLSSLMETFMQLGGEQLQINMVSSETLRRALQEPDAYRDLVVRVAGFTAYFVSLTPELQQEIIARAEA